jgi:predicted Zn-dependent protease
MTFRGTLTHAHDPNPRAITITLDQRALHAIADDGESIAVPLDALVFEPGGWGGDFVFCRPHDGRFVIATNDAGFIAALHQVGGASLAPALSKIGRHRATAQRNATFSKLGALIAILLIGSLLWNVPKILAASIVFLPTSIDRSLGDAAATDLSNGAIVSDPTAHAFIEEVRARLTPQAEGHEIRISIERNDIVNAFALPGGRVVVFSGLLCAAESGDQVAGVLAHELAHVTKRHSLRNLAHRAGIGLAISLLLGDVEGWTALAADVAALATQSQYSRTQESEADTEAVRIMSAAGLDPSALASFFGIMEARDNAEGDSPPSGALSWLSSHPDHQERIARIQELVSTSAPSARVALNVDWPAVRRAVCTSSE